MRRSFLGWVTGLLVLGVGCAGPPDAPRDPTSPAAFNAATGIIPQVSPTWSPAPAGISVAWTWSDTQSWDMVSFDVARDGTPVGSATAKPYVATTMVSRSVADPAVTAGDHVYCIDAMAQNKAPKHGPPGKSRSHTCFVATVGDFQPVLNLTSFVDATSAGLVFGGDGADYPGITGGVLRLCGATVPERQCRGAAWYDTRVAVRNGFESQFQFRMAPAGGGQGMAFVLEGQPDDPQGLVGDDGSDLGYGRIDKSLAIELDVGDDVSDHISIHACGLAPDGFSANVPTETGPCRQARANTTDLNDGAVHTLRVRYVPGNMQVYLDGSLTLTAAIDLGAIASGTGTMASVYDADGKAWIGFTASSSIGSYQDHDVLSWRFAD